MSASVQDPQSAIYRAQYMPQIDSSLIGLLEEEEEHSLSNILAAVFGQNSFPKSTERSLLYNTQKQYQTASFQPTNQNVYAIAHGYQNTYYKLPVRYITATVMPYIFSENYINRMPKTHRNDFQIMVANQILYTRNP